MGLGGLLKKAATVGAGIIGGPAGAAGVGIAADLIGGHKAKKQIGAGANYLADELSPYSTAGQAAIDQQQALLGLGGDKAAADAGFQNYLGSTGYDFALNEGNRAITAGQSVGGLRNSGATDKARIKYGQNTASQFFDRYLNHLGNVSGQGSQAIGAIGGAMSNAGARQAGITTDQAGGVAKGAASILKTVFG